MHNHHIEEMVDAVVESFINKGMLRKTVTSVLKDYWDDKIALVWDTDDVKTIAKENGRRLNKEQAKEVLASVLDNHDAAVGVNWDVLYYNLPEKK